MSTREDYFTMGPGFVTVLNPYSNLLHHRVKQFVFNEMVANPTKRWQGTEWIELYTKALIMCGTESPEPSQRANRDFYDYAIPEGWIVKA